MGSTKTSTTTQKSEKETAIEKAGVKVVTNYENLIENYQPALNELVQAATEIDTILFKYAEAQQRFNKALKGVVKACNSSVGNDDEAVDSIKEAEKLHKQISAEWKDFSEVYAADMIKPFDEKMTQGTPRLTGVYYNGPKDTKYLQDQMNTFKTKFAENSKMLQERQRQLEKLNKNRGKSKKDDKKRMELETEIAQRTEALEVYTKDKLRVTMVEQRKRYIYLVKKQSAHAAKLKLLYEQCGNHAEEYYPNIISNYGEELPVECEHEINSLFPSKRISVYHKPKEPTPERYASPSANSIYSSPSELSDNEIPPKPIESANGYFIGKPVQPSKSKKMVKATHGFNGSDNTQLKIEPGDYIQLLIPQPRDGWHYGENERTNLKGWFPIKYTIKL